MLRRLWPAVLISAALLVNLATVRAQHSEQPPAPAEAHGPGRHEMHEHHQTPSQSVGGQLIVWLGKFHPAAANFPVALLVAAALAELLFLCTRRPALDQAGRYCLWFGACGAVVTGTLGWFMGGFQAVDATWVKTTHRWLGTASDVATLGVLVLGELTWRKGGTRRRWTFCLLLVLVAVLVLGAGYFGGALVYGMNHYAWP